VIMPMIIYPHHGVDRIRFGMSRSDVERALGVAPRPSPRSKLTNVAEDFFDHLGLNVMYDEHVRCEAIGITPGFDVDAEYNGYHLLAHPAREVREWARAQDPNLDPKDGFLSKALGLYMFADWIDEPDLDPDELQQPGQAFVVFQPSYYDRFPRKA
jgi:hypothetical protein